MVEVSGVRVGEQRKREVKNQRMRARRRRDVNERGDEEEEGFEEVRFDLGEGEDRGEGVVVVVVCRSIDEMGVDDEMNV